MSEPRIGVIGIPGRWSTEVLADALEARTAYRQVINMADVALSLDEPMLSAGELDLAELDGVIVKKISAEYSPATLDRLELLRLAEAWGLRVFSGVDVMQGLVNRLSCTTRLRAADIPMPPTLISEDLDALLRFIGDCGAVVLKPMFSTKARGMLLLEAAAGEAVLRQALADYQQDNPVIYAQQKLALDGRDLGMVFLGGEYLCSYARIGDAGAWNTTIHSGGRYASFSPDAELIDLAQRAQAPFALDFTTVDVALTATGPVVFEVSAFGGFRGALEGAGVDAAAAYADYAIAALQP